MYQPGDRVVYKSTKHSAHPGPKAEAVEPERHGEGYSYNVRKYWRVLGVKADGTLTVVTRRGKQRDISASDPCLRPARWWERIFLASRFPASERINRQPPVDRPKGARVSVGA